ncbi:MAG: hypothetical protein SFY68_03945, partial [Candidatus Sumerlaeia bacterium]|nr:hypothetical protein [Candidatus Sumerlaeia bacterium]
PGDGGWCRYVGLIPPKKYKSQQFEVLQTQESDNIEQLRWMISPAPLEQRNGVPGEYPIKVQPLDYGAQSIVQIGDTHIHPQPMRDRGYTFGGYHVVTFDYETGRVFEHFRLSDEGDHVQTEPGMPYYVSVMQ